MKRLLLTCALVLFLVRPAGAHGFRSRVSIQSFGGFPASFAAHGCGFASFGCASSFAAPVFPFFQTQVLHFQAPVFQTFAVPQFQFAAPCAGVAQSYAAPAVAAAPCAGAAYQSAPVVPMAPAPAVFQQAVQQFAAPVVPQFASVPSFAQPFYASSALSSSLFVAQPAFAFNSFAVRSAAIRLHGVRGRGVNIQTFGGFGSDITVRRGLLGRTVVRVRN